MDRIRRLLAAPAFLPAAFAVLQFALVVYATRLGIGTVPDSVTYFEAAENLAAGHGYVSAGKPLTLYPPLYPAVLALLQLAGGDLIESGRWLHAILAAANITVCVVVARTASGGRPHAAMACGIAYLASYDLFLVHTVGLSEPLFLLLATSGLFALSRHAVSPAPLRLAAGSILLCGAVLTRFAGLPLVGIGAAGLLLFENASLRIRLRDAAIHCCATGLPAAAWMLRNRFVGGDGAGPRLAWHPVGLEDLYSGILAASSWLLHFEDPTWELQGMQVCFLALMVALALLLAWALRKEAPATVQWAKWCLLSICGYVGFVLLSVSVVYANTPLDGRILAPAFQLGLTGGCAVLAAHVLREPRAHFVVPCVALVAFAALTIAWMARLVPLASAAHRHGFGYTSEGWQTSPAIAFLKEVRPEAAVFTNLPDAVRLVARRPAQALPSLVDPQKRIPNPALAVETAAMIDDMRNGAIVAYFRIGPSRSYLMGEAELRALPVAMQTIDSDDAVFFRIAPGEGATPP